MDIRGWSLGQIMQLPDSVFGARWMVSTGDTLAVNGLNLAVSDDALPDICIIWEAFVWVCQSGANFSTVQFRLGDHVPAAAAEWDAFEYLFPTMYNTVGGRSALLCGGTRAIRVCALRYPVRAQGRRLAVRGTAVGTGLTFQAGIVVSSVPTEVPDCLVR